MCHTISYNELKYVDLSNNHNYSQWETERISKLEEEATKSIIQEFIKLHRERYIDLSEEEAKHLAVRLLFPLMKYYKINVLNPQISKLRSIITHVDRFQTSKINEDINDLLDFYSEFLHNWKTSFLLYEGAVCTVAYDDIMNMIDTDSWIKVSYRKPQKNKYLKNTVKSCRHKMCYCWRNFRGYGAKCCSNILSK